MSGNDTQLAGMIKQLPSLIHCSLGQSRQITNYKTMTMLEEKKKLDIYS